MSNEISSVLSTSDGINLSFLSIENVKTKKVVIFKYCELLPFEYPKFNINQPMLVGVNAQPQAVRGRLQSEFTFLINGLDNEGKDSIMSGLTELGLIPPPIQQIGTYKIYHTQLQTLGIREVFLLSIKHPKWSIGKMTWEFKCREGTKPQAVIPVDASSFTKAEDLGIVKPSIFQQVSAGRRI